MRVRVSVYLPRSLLIFLFYILLVTEAGFSRASAVSSNVVTVAAYNVENWLSMERGGQRGQPKPEEERDKVVAILAGIAPDVLGLAEVGTRDDLSDLSARLKAQDLVYPHQEWIEGSDTTRHVALLSRYPIDGRYSRTDYTYLLDGRVMRIQRGILDVKVRVNEGYAFRVIMLHLKSKRPSPGVDQATMRLEEARLVRAHVAKALKHDPGINLIVMGDLNDTEDSAPVRSIMGEPPFQLHDLRPVSHNGYFGTHYYRGKKQFSRIDYLLASPGMFQELVAGSARIAQPHEWFKASDHLAISAQFVPEDRGGVEPLVRSDATATAVPSEPAWPVVVVVVSVGGIVLLIWRRASSRTRRHARRR